jgi:hypothetical protein
MRKKAKPRNRIWSTIPAGIKREKGRPAGRYGSEEVWEERRRRIGRKGGNQLRSTRVLRQHQRSAIRFLYCEYDNHHKWKRPSGREQSKGVRSRVRNRHRQRAQLPVSARWAKGRALSDIRRPSLATLGIQIRGRCKSRSGSSPWRSLYRLLAQRGRASSLADRRAVVASFDRSTITFPSVHRPGLTGPGHAPTQRGAGLPRCRGRAVYFALVYYSSPLVYGYFLCCGMFPRRRG